MFFRWKYCAAVLVGSLLAGLLHAQFTFPPRKHEDIEAQLTVEVAKQTKERGRAEVTLTLTITGPTTLEVEGLRLDDAASAWQEERLPSTRRLEGQHAVWSQTVHLKQLKGGPEPLPEVTIRFRRGTDAEWFEEKWIDILRDIHDCLDIPQPNSEGSSGLWRWGLTLILAAMVLLVLSVWLKKQQHVCRQSSLPSHQWALGEIERIEKTLKPPQSKAETYYTQLSFVIRRYLAERFGLPTLQQTTAEFLEAIRQIPEWSAEKQALLSELLQRCDLAKFAHIGVSAEECRYAAELARDLVQQTSKR